MVSFFYQYQAEFVSLAQLFVGWAFLLFLLKDYAESGIYLYIGVAVILSNIQVLKFGYFFWSAEPVALGTVTFASTFLATDILCEFYTEKSAKRSVNLGFLGFAFFSIAMLLHIYIPQIGDSKANELSIVDGHAAMEALFLPMPALLVASLVSYFASERLDIYLYLVFKKHTKGKFLWLRSVGAATLSAFVDTAIFSVLAFKLFALQPVEWPVLFHTYILGSFWPRILISLSGVPVLYLIKHKMSQSTISQQSF